MAQQPKPIWPAIVEFTQDKKSTEHLKALK
jgi:hypothetical protein